MLNRNLQYGINGGYDLLDHILILEKTGNFLNREMRLL